VENLCLTDAENASVMEMAIYHDCTDQIPASIRKTLQSEPSNHATGWVNA
jgi:hypothetical protein